MQMVGSWLKSAREERGVPLEVISEATKINLIFLSALEQDRFDRLPGGMFPRAMVRAYARALGACEQTALKIYGEQFPPPLVPAPEPASMRNWMPLFRFSAFLVLFLLAATTGLWYLRTEWRNHSGTRNLSNAPSPALTTSGPVVTASVLPKRDLSDEKEVSGLNLQVLVLEECWLSLSADGTTVDRRLLKKGEALTYHAENSFEALVGNAGGIKLVVNGRQWKNLGSPYNVKRIRINKADGKVRVTT